MSAAVYLLTQDKVKVALRGIKNLVKGDNPELNVAYKELMAEKSFHRHVQSTLAGQFFGQPDPLTAAALYVLCRTIKPRCVVETGVAAGVSSAFILMALKNNGYGRLYSIDLPNNEQQCTLPPGKESGFVVPEGLRQNWNLRIGKTSEVLPRLLDELGEIDLFFHDSEHTYANMLLEYMTAWWHLRLGSLLLSHDVACNSAFFDFATRLRLRRVRIWFTGIGAAKKFSLGDDSV